MKTIVRKLRKSYKLTDAFKNCQDLEGLPERALERGIEVRWSSLYKMLKSFLDNKAAIELLIEEENKKVKSKRIILPDIEKSQWRQMESIKNSLQMFCEATTFLQSREATISMVIPLSETLKLHVQKNIDNDIGDEALNQALLKHLKTRFDTFKFTEKYITATFLNPNFKLKSLNKDRKQIYFDSIIDELVKICFL